MTGRSRWSARRQDYFNQIKWDKLCKMLNMTSQNTPSRRFGDEARRDSVLGMRRAPDAATNMRTEVTLRGGKR